MRSTLLQIAAVAATSVCGVTQAPVVSPPHAVNVEGNSSSGVTFTTPTTRTQQADGNLIGSNVVLIRGIAFRRTNIHSRIGATARKADVTIDMGYRAATYTNTFDNNFLAPTRKTVHAKKTINLPDWTQPTTTPAPFDLIIKFDAPWVYDRKQALVWDIKVENNTGGGPYYMDWFSVVPPITSGDRPTDLGTGCTTKNGTFTHTASYTADANTLFLQWNGANGPAIAPALLILGSKDLNATIGLCTKLHGDLTFILPIGATSATGAVTAKLQVPWSNGFRGLPFVTQLAAFDTTQASLPWALTNGVKGTAPHVVGGGATTAFLIDRLWSNTSTGPTGSMSTTCAPVQYQ